MGCAAEETRAAATSCGCKNHFDAPDLLPVAPGSLDAVVMNMNYHDLVLFKFDRANVNAAVFKALKPGGFYDIVDHSAKDGSGI